MPLRIVQNDITKMEVDAIVNAANSSLLGGGGVDGCIHRAAGPKLLAECMQREQEQLASCYRTSLTLAKEYDCRTVAFPLISSGIYGYPKAQALQTAIDTIRDFLKENDMTVYLVLFDREACKIAEKIFVEEL